MTTIFIDMEGARVEELAAIAVNSETLQILDVFHEFALPQLCDLWSRKHVHGLSEEWLNHHAQYNNEEELMCAFRLWLRGKNMMAMLANDPAKERQAFGKLFNITDLCFPTWERREQRPSHQMAFHFKESFIPVLNKRCCRLAHSEFTHYPAYRGTPNEFARKRWGVHCALYDCYEAYLSFVEDRNLESARLFSRLSKIANI